MPLLHALARNKPNRWRFRGMPFGEFVDHARVELALEMCQNGLRSAEKVGASATIRFLRRVRDERVAACRRTEREVSDPGHLLHPADLPSPEEEAATREEYLLWGRVLDHVSGGLSRTQLGWLVAFREDIEAHGDLDLARAARPSGRTRAAASQARKVLEDVARTALATGKFR